MHTPKRRRNRLVIALGAFALLATACSDNGQAAGTSGTPAAANADTNTGSHPSAIVSLSPTATEMLFAIGAGADVVAADSFSNHPDDAPTTDLSAFTPNVEAIITYEPDLVILSQDRDDVVAALDAVDVATLILPAAADLDEVYEQILLLGSVTGEEDGASDVVADMQNEIDTLLASVPDRDEPLTYYHELTADLYSTTSNTFIGAIYTLAGLENIADAADPDGAAGGFPQLSAEFLLDADPDLVFLADTKCCGEDADTFGARDGFSVLSAVQNGFVYEQDDDIASRWGPRIVDFFAVVIAATTAVDA